MKAKLLIIFLLLFQKSYAQDYIVKGMAFTMQLKGSSVITTNIGFEKKIINNVYFDLNINYLLTDSESSGGEYKRILPSFKFYINDKDNPIINNVWGNILFRISNESYSEGGEISGLFSNGFGFGMGLGVGKKMYLTKKQRLFIDIGFTVSYGKFIYKRYDYFIDDGYGNIIHKYSGHDPTYNYYYRPFIQIGYTIKPKWNGHINTSW